MWNTYQQEKLHHQHLIQMALCSRWQEASALVEMIHGMINHENRTENVDLVKSINNQLMVSYSFKASSSQSF
jgi:ribosomal protein L31E